MIKNAINDLNKKLRGVANLSLEKRKEIAAKANITKEIRKKAQHELKKLPKATHGSEDTPIIIGKMYIPAYVLDDGRRMLSQGGMAGTLGLSSSGGQRISRLLSVKSLSPFVSSELLEKIDNPILFISHKTKTHGYEADILVDICCAILEARKAGSDIKISLVEEAETIIKSVAKVGIIALIDEATGYQEERKKGALAQILEKYIQKELRPWAKTFPFDFYQELCRLKNIHLDIDDFMGRKSGFPQYFGTLINNIVYKRLAPGVWKELKENRTLNKNGNPKGNLHQNLTGEFGKQKIIGHLGSVVTLMKMSNSYEEFMESLEKIHPQYPQTEEETALLTIKL